MPCIHSCLLLTNLTRRLIATDNWQEIVRLGQAAMTS